MPHDPDAVPRSAKPIRSYAVVVFALLIGLFLGVLSVGTIGWAMLSHNSGRELLSHMWSVATGRTLSIDVSQPTVVDRIQRLQRLETVVYTTDKLVTGAKENPIFPDFLAGDRLLMLVHGEVRNEGAIQKACSDLGIARRGETAEISAPAPGTVRVLAQAARRAAM